MWAVRLLIAQGAALCAEQARRAIWNTRGMLEKVTTGHHYCARGLSWSGSKTL